MNRKNGLSRYRQRKLVAAFCADLTATQAALLLGLNRNTANRYWRIFRERIRDHQASLAALSEPFHAIVEVDESYFGATRRRGARGPAKRGRGSKKRPVFGIVERGGRVFTEVVPDTKKRTLQDLIRGRVALDATVMSDAYVSYHGLVDMGYDRHLRLKKYYSDRVWFTDGELHINGIEAFWSFAKRRLAKFNGTTRNFELHIKQCEWRWRKDTATLKEGLVSAAVVAAR